MFARCDFYSDEEYQQALLLAEEELYEEFYEELAKKEYEEQCAYEEYLKGGESDAY